MADIEISNPLSISSPFTPYGRHHHRPLFVSHISSQQCIWAGHLRVADTSHVRSVRILGYVASNNHIDANHSERGAAHSKRGVDGRPRSLDGEDDQPNPRGASALPKLATASEASAHLRLAKPRVEALEPKAYGQLIDALARILAAPPGDGNKTTDNDSSSRIRRRHDRD
jgi:hypothetical protein